MIMVIIIKIVNDKKNTPSFHAKYFPGNYGALMKKNITISSISMSKISLFLEKEKKILNSKDLMHSAAIKTQHFFTSKIFSS